MKNLDADFLDEALQSDSQQAVARWVHELPEEGLSLAWRSQLNEKLLVVAKPKPRRLSHWILGSVGAATVAGGLAGIFALNLVQTPPSLVGNHLEGSIMASHRKAASMSEVAGSGLDFDEMVASSSDSTSTPTSHTSPPQWKREDVEDF